MNNTRITYPDSLDPATYVCATAQECLRHCVNNLTCGK